MEIHPDHAVGTGRHHEICGEFCADRHPRLVLSILPPIAEIGDDRRHPSRGSALRGIDQEQQLHDRVRWSDGGLNDEYISPTRIELDAALAIIDKRRPGPNLAEVANVVGDVDGRTCLLIDDMVDTGGTLANAVVALKERGATKVFAGATHALLSGSAVEKLAAAPLEEFVVTNTIHVPEERRFEGLKILSVASLFATAIECVHENKSVSQLFELAAEADSGG